MTTIKVFNVCSHSKEDTTGDAGRPTSSVVAFNPKEKNRFATGGGDNNILMYHLSNNSKSGFEVLSKLSFHSKQINCLEWSPNGDILAAGSDDGSVSLWIKDNNYIIPNEPMFGENIKYNEKWKLKSRIKEDSSNDIIDLQWANDKYNQNTLLLFAASVIGYVFIYEIFNNNNNIKNKNNINIKNNEIIHNVNIVRRKNDANNNNNNDNKFQKTNNNVENDKFNKNIKNNNIKDDYKLIQTIPNNRGSFTQGIAIDNIYCNFIAIQSTDRSCRIFKRKIKQKTKKNNFEMSLINEINSIKFQFNYEKYCNLTYYPQKPKPKPILIKKINKKQIKNDLKLKKNNNNNNECDNNTEDQKSIEINESSNDSNNNEKMKDETNDIDINNNNNANNANNQDSNNLIEESKIEECKIVKEKRRNFFASNVMTLSKRPDWSPDSLFLCTVCGQPKSTDSLNVSAIHLFHRSNLQQKYFSFYCNDTSRIISVKFNPFLYEISENDNIEPNSICDKYNIKYKMLFAAISDSELFIFDSLKNTYPVFYWRDDDVRHFVDLSWNSEGNQLLISDKESFLTLVIFNQNDLGKRYYLNNNEINNEINNDINIPSMDAINENDILMTDKQQSSKVINVINLNNDNRNEKNSNVNNENVNILNNVCNIAEESVNILVSKGKEE